ncbi:hypothetical protein BU25DRAFT_471635 [Macroventuria anomochaeta]|uniref:Uncharacterized protein n=1 Tax=Macroventuria anomochaeta TaxID=301207 RepID=A0ACB6RXF4_9PLEO|nr:uncharacterized protein BU25DRAFT_471635 [Macroventuria anomochaeta]KAF2626655.1 hypothetical protein BU25DRAFT_471635 [Macroventuria anomochaeta]
MEEEWVCAYVGHPGLVLTDMSIEAFGEEAVRRMGSITVERSVEGLEESGRSNKRENGGCFQELGMEVRCLGRCSGLVDKGWV